MAAKAASCSSANRTTPSVSTQIIETRDSKIPNGGKGVFATQFIPKGTKICRYKGRIVSRNQYMNLIRREQDRGFEVATDNIIIGSNIGSNINDNVILGKYDLEGTKKVFDDKSLFRFADTTLNCDFVRRDGKLFIYSTTDINAGDELYVDYGFNYWVPRMIQWGLFTVPRQEDGKQEITNRLLIKH